MMKALLLSLCIGLSASGAWASQNLDYYAVVQIKYSNVLKKYHTDKAFIERLQVSQKLWEKYLASINELEYPDDNYFSAQKYCTGANYQKLAQQRAEILDRYLADPKEGELCWDQG